MKISNTNKISLIDLSKISSYTKTIGKWGNIVEGNNIIIDGVISSNFSFFSKTISPADIKASLDLLNEDDSIKEIDLHINSPGGDATGEIFNLADILRNNIKPIKTAYVYNLCCSGAYLLASQAKQIIAKYEASMIGSIGVLANFYIDENETIISSRGLKSPDPTSPEGKEYYTKQVKKIDDIFVNNIIEGPRGSKFGRKEIDQLNGKTCFAKEAKQIKLIDKIEKKNIMSKEIQEQVKQETEIKIETNQKEIMDNKKEDEIKEQATKEAIINNQSRIKMFLPFMGLDKEYVSKCIADPEKHFTEEDSAYFANIATQKNTIKEINENAEMHNPNIKMKEEQEEEEDPALAELKAKNKEVLETTKKTNVIII